MSGETEPACSDPGAIVAKLNLATDGLRILQLHLNRPEKRNALTLAMLEELHRRLAQEVDGVVIASAGPSFCAGLDLDECRNDAAWPRPLPHLEMLAAVYRQLLNSPASIIAFVQGFAVGGGVGLAACADVVIASSDARLRLPQGELASLARIVQPVIEARQIARRGAARWQAAELDARAALAAGLIDEIVEPAAIAGRREEALREFVPRLSQQPSWRTPERCRAIEEAMRLILTELSR